VDDARLRVCLERELELAPVQVRFREWPGRAGPLVHVPDPLAPSGLVDAIATACAPRYRVLSIEPRTGVSYQMDAFDVLGVLDAFGFVKPVLLGEGLGAVPVLLAAVWEPSRVGGLLLLRPRHRPPAGLQRLAGRGLVDCPPDWTTLIAACRCPLLTLETLDLDQLDRFLTDLDAPR
jgi:pimeloyl-ACP methyl ester carboxylesterase